MLVLSAAGVSYSQDAPYDFRYEFKIVGVTEDASAKMKIDLIRDVMGVKRINFDATLDKFIVFSNYGFDVEELFMKLEMNDLDIEGEIMKIEIE